MTRFEAMYPKCGTDHITKAAEQANHEAAQIANGDNRLFWRIRDERFYALAFKQGMERAAEIADDLPAPASCSGSERSLWDVASTECAGAIRAEAHAQTQTEGN